MQANQIINASYVYISQVLRIPSNSRQPTEVNAYTTEINEEGRQEVLMLGKYFTYLSPFMYSIREDGTITNMQEEQILEAAKTKKLPS